jgi:hypothetical protein
MEVETKPVGAWDTETIDGKIAVLAVAFGRPGAILRQAMDVRRWNFVLILKTLAESVPVAWTYNLDYDVLALLKKYVKYEALIESLVYFNRVEIEGWDITWLPGKFFEAKNKKLRCKFTAYDLFPFYQRSLDRAARDVLKKGKKDLDVSGGVAKYFRTKKLKAKMLAYAAADAELTYRLGEKIVEAFASEGIYPKAWYSPGYVAKGILKDLHVCTPPPDWVQNIAKNAYYGGRIEALQRGRFNEIRSVDIASAYPDAIRRLICVCGAAYRYKDGAPPNGSDYYIAKVRVFCKRKDTGPFPLRRKGRAIVYPVGAFETWATKPEIEAARKTCVIVFVKTLAVKCARKVHPWTIVEKWYKRRKASPQASIAWKLVLNSLYGIMAETRRRWVAIKEKDAMIPRYLRALKLQTLRSDAGARECKKHFPPVPKECGKCAIAKVVNRAYKGEKPPQVALTNDGRILEQQQSRGPVANMIHAGWITGSVRARLWTEVLATPLSKRVIALATDGVYFAGSSKPRMRYGSKLGDWKDEGKGKRAVFIGGGVYEYTGSDGKVVSKHRGFRGIRGKIRIAVRRAVSAGRDVLEFSVLEHQSPALLIDRGASLRNVNELVDKERVLRLNSDTKRKWPAPFPKRGAQVSKAIVCVVDAKLRRRGRAKVAKRNGAKAVR